MTATPDILRALRKLCGESGARVTVAAIAKAAGVSEKTVRRALPKLVHAGLVTREGGQGAVATFRTSVTTQKNGRMTEVPNRIYEDPADLTPGAEYSPIPPGKLDEVRRDRARVMFARTGRWPSWAQEVRR